MYADMYVDSVDVFFGSELLVFRVAQSAFVPHGVATLSRLLKIIGLFCRI